MKIVFFGTPSFAANILTYLIKNKVNVVAIVTKEDKPQGRSAKRVFTAVKKEAVENYPQIPLFQVENASDPTFAKELQSFQSDLFVVVAFGEIIKANLLKMPKLGCINVHASLLPKYRGASPIQFALLNGDQESGVTIMEMAPKMDSGDIIKQVVVPIDENMNFEELENKLWEAGAKGLLEVIHAFQKGKVQKTPQDHHLATYVKKIDPSMAKIDWEESATVVHNRIRAFSPKPGAWCIAYLNGQPKRLKILRTRVSKEFQGKSGSASLIEKKRLLVHCRQDSLELLEVQVEGKKAMPIENFLQGYQAIHFNENQS